MLECERCQFVALANRRVGGNTTFRTQWTQVATATATTTCNYNRKYVLWRSQQTYGAGVVIVVAAAELCNTSSLLLLLATAIVLQFSTVWQQTLFPTPESMLFFVHTHAHTYTNCISGT